MASLDDVARLAQSATAAGFFGAALSLKWLPGGRCGDKLANLLGGVLIAKYGAPGVALLLSLPPGSEMTGLLGFGLGLFGVSLTSAVMSAVTKLPAAEIITGWLSRK